MLEIGLNGFGRIGRNFVKLYLSDKDKNFKFSRINDIYDKDVLVHLYNVNQKESCLKLSSNKNGISSADEQINFTSEDIDDIKWETENIVIDATGKFYERKNAQKHLKSNPETVIISSPSAEADITLVKGINETEFNDEKHKIISASSCTSEATIPILKALEPLEIENFYVTTVHPYTVNNTLLDMPKRNLRESRSSTLSIVPAQTKSDIGLKPLFSNIDFKAFSFKVPTAKVAALDLVIYIKKKTNVEEVNNLLSKYSKDHEELLQICDEPLVSCDFIDNPTSSIVNSSLTQTIDNLVRVFSWYDNEWAYSKRLYALVKHVVNEKSKS